LVFEFPYAEGDTENGVAGRPRFCEAVFPQAKTIAAESAKGVAEDLNL